MQRKGRSPTHRALHVDGDVQHIRRLPCQIQPQSAGGALQAPVFPGIPLLKDPGQVLRGNANARVADVQGILLYADGDASPRRRILNGI